jgi:hypothetical protein
MSLRPPFVVKGKANVVNDSKRSIFTKNDPRNIKTSQDDSGLLKSSSPTTTSDLVNSLDLSTPPPPQNNSSNPFPPPPPTSSMSQSVDPTSITKIVQPIVHAIMEHKQSLEKSKGLIDQNIADLQAKGETDAAEKLKKEQEVAALQLEKEKTTVYDIKAHITLYSDNNAVYYKNISVELFSYDSDKKLGFLSKTVSPYSYDFNDANKFTKLTNSTIGEYTNKINIDSMITNLDQASKYDKFNKGWVSTSDTIPSLNPGKVDTLVIDFQFFIKGENIYAELPKVAFGQPTNVDAKTIGTLTKINTLTKPEDMNAKIVFGPVKDSLKDTILSKLNAHYQHTEVVDSSAEAAQSGFDPTKMLFGNKKGGNFISYLLKPKRTRGKTLKKASKKMSKKNSKKVSKKSRKSRK